MSAEVPRKKGERAVETQASALPALVAGVTENSTWAVAAAAEDSRSSEAAAGWLGSSRSRTRTRKTSCIVVSSSARATTLRRSTGTSASGVRRGVLRSYKEEREVSYLSMNAVIRTDGAVKMTKPASRKRKGELDLGSEEQTRIFSAA